MDILGTIFHYLYYWTATFGLWLYQLAGWSFKHYVIAGAIVIGLFVLYKVLFDKGY